MEHSIRKIYLIKIDIVDRTTFKDSSLEGYTHKTTPAEWNIFKNCSFESNIIIVTFFNKDILIDGVLTQALKKTNLWECDIAITIVREFWVEIAAKGNFSIFKVWIMDQHPSIKHVLKLKVFIFEFVEFTFIGGEIFLGGVSDFCIDIA